MPEAGRPRQLTRWQLAMKPRHVAALKMARRVLIFALGTLAAQGCVRAVYGTHHGRVKIVNGSDETIVKGDVVICGQRFDFDNLRSNEFRTFLYQIAGCPGQDYRVAVTFESGDAIIRRVGYVTNGFDFSDEVIVKRDNIALGYAWVGDRLDDSPR